MSSADTAGPPSAHTRPRTGGFTITIPQEQFDDLFSRISLAALFYYPEVAVDADGPNLQRNRRSDPKIYQSELEANAAARRLKRSRTRTVA